MSTPTNIPETPMGETKQDSFFGSKEKFHEQLQDMFQTILRLTGPDHFDQLCQWMEYKQYYTIDLPNLTSHSTFHKCSRGTPCQPQAPLHKHLTKPVVIISYSIHLERKITSLLTSTTRWNITTESTQKKSIYSNSKKPTTFQVGIHSSSSLTKST